MFKFYKKICPLMLPVVLIIGIIIYNRQEAYNEMSYNLFLSLLSSNMVYSIEGNEESEYVTFKVKRDYYAIEPDNLQYRVYATGGFKYAFELAEKQDVRIIETEIKTSETSNIIDENPLLVLSKSIAIGIPILFVIAISIYYFKNKSRLVTVNIVTDKSGNINKSKYTNVTFDDVAALDEEKFELMEIVDFLKYPERYTKLGAKMPRGVLLEGKPGTGKTLLAKAVAGEAGVSFISSSGSGFVNRFVGVGADNIRKLFEKARKEAPCIVFIDEIDGIGEKRREEDCGGNSERNQTIDQLLTELDGFQTRDNIITFAATNNPKVLDPALTRPGRFDRIIHVGLPDVRGRKAILKVHSRNKPLFEDVSLKDIAKNTAGFSGAQLANLLNEAAIHAARNKHTAISNEDVKEAFRKITVGLKKSYIMSEEEKKITATHEAGHAIVSLFMSTQPNIKEVSIIPHNTAGGYTWNDTTEDKNYSSKNELTEKLAVLMAGRVAEKIIIGDISTGASKDIEIATQIATSMVSVYGMDSDIGPISVKSIDARGINSLDEQIGDKILKLMKDAEEKASELIAKHQPLVEKVIQILLEQETLTGEEIQQIYSYYNSQCAK